MIKITTTTCIIILLFMASSCTTEEQMHELHQPALTFLATIEAPQPETRMATGSTGSQTFTVGDKIGLYAVAYTDKNTPLTLSSTLNSADNAPYTAEKATAGEVLFNSVNPIRFPSGLIKILDIYAYYPYTEVGFVPNTTQLKVSVQLDQTTDDNFWKSDFMTAEEKKVTQDRATTSDDTQRLKFEFAHRFSLVNFEVKQGTAFTSLDELETPTLKITNLATEATFDWTATSLLAPDEVSEAVIVPHGAFSKATDEATVLSGVTALLIPQTIAAETVMCKVTAAGMTFPCCLSAPFTLEEGKSYTFTLILNKSQISAISPTIAPWLPSSTIGDIIPDYPEIID